MPADRELRSRKKTCSTSVKGAVEAAGGRKFIPNHLKDDLPYTVCYNKLYLLSALKSQRMPLFRKIKAQKLTVSKVMYITLERRKVHGKAL